MISQNWPLWGWSMGLVKALNESPQLFPDCQAVQVHSCSPEASDKSYGTRNVPNLITEIRGKQGVLKVTIPMVLAQNCWPHIVDNCPIWLSLVLFLIGDKGAHNRDKLKRVCIGRSTVLYWSKRRFLLTQYWYTYWYSKCCSFGLLRTT